VWHRRKSGVKEGMEKKGKPRAKDLERMKRETAVFWDLKTGEQSRTAKSTIRCGKDEGEDRYRIRKREQDVYQRN